MIDSHCHLDHEPLHANIKDIIKRSLLLFENYNKNNLEKYNISFSYGIVDYNPLHHHNIDALMADGDVKMYHQKNKKINH